MTQDLRPHDRRADPLFRNLHALLHGRHAEELPAVGVPHDQFDEPIDSRDKVSEVLEVSLDLLLQSLVSVCLVGVEARKGILRRPGMEPSQEKELIYICRTRNGWEYVHCKVNATLRAGDGREIEMA